MNPRILLADIHALEEELLTFERQYGVRSDLFMLPTSKARSQMMRRGCLILPSGLVYTAPG